MPEWRIAFNRASFLGNEQRYIFEAIAGAHISGDGPFTKSCNAMLSEATGGGDVLLTTSCTHALEMTALLLGLCPGDEVIMPSFTFVSTANAFALRGARPIFVDIRPDTLNIDERRIEEKITPRTKAIVVVHYGGIACEMDTIGEIARRHGLPVIEDNAHGLFGTYRGRPLGSFGAFATQSFHETKNVTCGEGGALVINDRSYVERAEIVREKGTNRNRFFRGEIDKYTWVDIGSSYLPSEILAAFLAGQLEAAETIQRRRQAIWKRYDDAFATRARSHGVQTPTVPPECGHPAHLYYLLLPTPEKRQDFIAALRSRNIVSVFHYLPLHLSEQGKRFGGRFGDCPVTESVSDRLVRLPLFYAMTDAEVERVIDVALDFARGMTAKVS